MDKEFNSLMKQFDDKIKECEENNDEEGVLKLYGMLNELQQELKNIIWN